MIIAIGSDLVDCRRIAKALSRYGDHFARRILCPQEYALYQERGHCPSFVAKRFAAKEAIGKALGTGIGQGISWQHIAILPNELGAPQVELCEAAARRAVKVGGNHWHVSLSDEKNYALAWVIFERRPG